MYDFVCVYDDFVSIELPTILIVSAFQDLVLSWGVDGKLCLWDSRSEGQVNAPISVLTSDKDYPLYAADIVERKTNSPSENPIEHIAIGGGRDAGFMGVLIYLHDFCKK